MLRHITRLVLLCSLALTAFAARGDVIIDWNNVALDAIRSNATSPPIASRTLAMMHAAMFNAVNSFDLRYQAYHSYQTPIPGASAEAAAAQAARDVLVSVYPTQVAVFDLALAGSLGQIPDGESKTNGIALGQAVANDIVVWRSSDGWDTVVPFTPSTDPGQWQPTPPGFAPAALPNWQYVTPFTMTSGAQFRGAGPPDLSSVEYAEALAEAALLGRLDSMVRTLDQTQIAFFWADGAGTSTPPGHWNLVAQTISAQLGTNQDLVANARLFALMNIAMADAAIAAWDDKYTYDFWRPITPLQMDDPDWLPLLITPPFPEYVSGHSTFSGAAAEMLALFYSTDDIAFTIGSEGLPGVTRSYDSFWEAALEAGRSRIYGGLHFEFSNTDGLTAGQAISEQAFAGNLKPIPETSTFVLAVLSGAIGLAGHARALLRRRRQ